MSSTVTLRRRIRNKLDASITNQKGKRDKVSGFWNPEGQTHVEISTLKECEWQKESLG